MSQKRWFFKWGLLVILALSWLGIGLVVSYAPGLSLRALLISDYSTELCAQAIGEPAASPKLQGAANHGNLPLYFIENRGQVDQHVKFYTRGKGQTMFFTQEGVVLTLVRPGGVSADQSSLGRKSEAGKWTMPYPDKDLQGLDRQLHDLLTPSLALYSGKTLSKELAQGWLRKPFYCRFSRSAHFRGHKKPIPVTASVVRMQPVGMRKQVKIKTLELQDCKVNYFIGNNPKKWQTNIPTYAGVLYQEAYSGIDLKFYGKGRELEYDVVVKPGADPGQVRFAYEGIKEMRVTPEGHLALFLQDGGELIQKKPLVYQEIAAQRVLREGRFRVQGDSAQCVTGFEVATYDTAHPLVIDPSLVFSTYLGGSDYDACYAVAADRQGCAYVTGPTYSTDFPGSGTATNKGGADVFIAKINAAGNALVYSTYVGGNNDDAGYTLAVDQNGNAFVAGTTFSEDFPTKNPFQAAMPGAPDAFVFKLNAAGTDLIYASFLGGSADEGGYGIAVDVAGNAYVTGYTGSTNFPTLAPFQLHLAGLYNGYITKVSPAGALLYSTYLGGTVDDQGNAVTVDGDGNAYLTGYTGSPDFPLQGPLQPNLQGNYNAFVTKIAPGGSSLVYSTYLGGSADDEGFAIALDNAGNAFVAGHASSPDFPTLFPLQATLKGDGDAFVSKLSAEGSALKFSTFLGRQFL